MFYSHQLRDREALIRQMWTPATLHAKKNRRKLDQNDIIRICKEILNPSVPMALKLLGTLRGVVVIVNEREVSLLHDDANRLLDEIKSAWQVKPAVDPTFLLKDKNEAKFEAVTLPENNADIGDVEQSIDDSSNKFTGSATFQQSACLVMHAKAKSAVNLSELAELPPVALSCELVGRNHDVHHPKPDLDLWITNTSPAEIFCYRKDYLMFNSVGTSNPSATAAISETGTPQTQCPAFPPPEESPKQPENNAAPGDDNRREIELPQPNAPLPVNQAPVQDPAPPIQGPAPMGGPAPLIRGPAPIPQENPIPILFAHPSGGMATRDFNNLELIGMTTREECLPLGNIEALQPHIQALVSHHHLVTNIPFFSMLLQHDKPRYNTRFEAVTLPENNADIGDVEQSIDYSNKFTGSATFQQPACLVMRLDNIDELTESFREKETNAGCHQDGNIRNSSVADDIINRHPVTQTDQSFPQLWEAGQVTIKPQQHLQKQKPASKEAREAPGIMDNEQTMILSNLYQTCGQSSVDIQFKCPKTAEHAKAESAVKLSKLVELPPVALSCELVGRNQYVYYPKPNLDLWITSMQPLQDSPFDSGRCYRKDYLMFNGVGTSNPSATAAISDSSPGPGFVEPPQPSLIADHGNIYELLVHVVAAFVWGKLLTQHSSLAHCLTGTPQTQRPAFPQQPENNAAPGLPRPNAASPEIHVPIRGPAPIQGPARIRGPVPVPQETPIPILFAHPTGGPQYADDFFDNLELIGMTTREECLPLGNIEALQPHIQALVSHHHLVTNVRFFSMLLQHDKPRYNTRFLTLPILYDRLITLTDRIIILHPDYIRRN
ncbi:hypothetical protein BVRB_2g026020 isoform A [Beta vulgaris subsp. vulgaris]|nr:hypothetical protein BVRB_2g026020 isoform A [Beta vulgaris subsp. vulgaris]